jgi:hypothetical protein
MPRFDLFRTLLVLWLALAALGASAGSASAAPPLFPDLKSLPPRSLHLGKANVGYDGGGALDYVLRFSNTVWNAGPGALDIRGHIDPDTQRGAAYQRVFDSAGGHVDYPIGSDFYYHQAHHHFHLDDWGRYELWTRADYDSWVAGGRTSASAAIQGHKISSCALDDEFVADIPGTPADPQFQFSGCSTDANGNLSEGLSPGWGDTYDYTRYDQWIDVGSTPLPDGDYVLRTVMDPLNKIYESPGRGGDAQESQTDNEAITPLTVRDGKLVDLAPPTGWVQINDVDRRTASSKVRVSVMGRDDVSGVSQFRVSNDGKSWQTFTYTGGEMDRQTVAWDLADSRYGGSTAGGTRSVFVQFADRSGKWGPTAKDTIELTACASSTGVPSGYAEAVRADRPVSFWRLGETCGAVATDAQARNSGDLTGSPALGAPGLLANELGNKAVSFDGRAQWVRVAPSPSLDLSSRMSLEAWIRPRTLPAPGHYASVITRPTAYSLQFDGPRVEFALFREGDRHHASAPAGSIRAGRAYHLVGTFDGQTERLYLNGRLVSSASSPPPSGSSAALFLGAWRESVELFTGTLDEVAVYNGTLSGARIAAHYRAAELPPAVAAPGNLVGVARRRHRVTLTWANDATHESGLLLERSPDRRFRHPGHRHLRAHTTTFTDVHVRGGTVYWYRLRAYTATHKSAWSRAARVRTPGRHPR